ncbi:hypothetical protein MMC07_000211 [Pseudocyphellaria aurata]|nr:hypothetical protein [Pseudocyphellaria aurata]
MAQQCLTPSGAVLQGFGLCNPNSSTSVCCKLGEACTENGLCSTPAGFLYRGGCTDESFKSKSCPTLCIDNFDRPWVTECQKSADGSALYCCDGDSTGDCCNDTGSTFIIGAVVTAVTSVTATETGSHTTPSSAEPTTSTASTTSASIQETTSSDSSVKIGVGIGVGIAALIIIGLAMVWFFRRRRGKDKKKSNHVDPGLPHEEALSPPKPPSELAHDRTTEIPAELPQGQNHPVEMDAGTEVRHFDGASNEKPFMNTETNHPQGLPNVPSLSPAPSPEFQRTVRPAFSTSSMVHPGLLDAAATASRFLDRPNTAPTPVPSPEPSEQLARSSSHHEAPAPLSPDENPLQPFPPKSSRSRLPPPLSSNQPSAAVADRLNPPPPLSANQPSTAVVDRLNPLAHKRSFYSAPATPRRALQHIFSKTPKQPSVQVVPPSPQQPVTGVSLAPTRETRVKENVPSTIKAMLRNHPQPLQSNPPLAFASPPSTESVVHEPPPVDYPRRGTSMANSSLVDRDTATGAHQGSDPAGAMGKVSSSTDSATFQPSAHAANVPGSSARDQSAIRNYSHKLTTQQAQQSRSGTSSAHVENAGTA